eukprot:CAMPEP_0182519372 /NCGR_PEP_ID=MMETSP1321-20130603/45064_1 /TAXON_ID=91990 /ORGANISM="Bolidomonas sp., Strain RCC1657" /LENGTH=62 /DNA_ID=CAMNT_0024727345 /DNA_START=360 /DNA_END=548 /DNA_ORIENTATION=+
MQEVEEISRFEYFPDAHLVHTVEASSVEIVPALQLVHVLAPVVELAFPASHATQVVEDGVEL